MTDKIEEEATRREESVQGQLRVIVRLQPTYADGPVAVSVRSEGKDSSPTVIGLFTEFALRRRLAHIGKRTNDQVEMIMRKFLGAPRGHEFVEQFHGSWERALHAWNGVGTPTEIRPLVWHCRKPGCPAPVRQSRAATLPDQVILLRCEACGSRRRIDPAAPDEDG